MKQWIRLIFLLWVAGMMCFGCGGSGGGSDGGPGPENTTIVRGVAAAGAPVVGIVNVKGANGATASSKIQADGSYEINVTALTAPYILYAEGSVNGKGISMYSVGVAYGTINITPITDFIVRNAVQGSAEDAYQDWSASSVSAGTLSAAETDVQAQLQPLLSAAELSSDINLLTSPFQANHGGLDAVLDVLEISYSGNTATVVNTITGSMYDDDITQSGADQGLPDTDEDNSRLILVENGISAFWESLEALYATQPTNAAIKAWFNAHVADDYFSDGLMKSDMLDEWLNDEGPGVGLIVSAEIIDMLDVSSTDYVKGYSIKLNYVDGSESGSDMDAMVFDGTKWLWYGDRKWIGTWANASALMRVESDSYTTLESGIDFSIDDDYNYAYDHDARSAYIMGPGLPKEGLILEHRFPETYFGIYDKGSFDSFCTPNEGLVIDDVPDAAEYTVYVCSDSAYDLYKNGIDSAHVLTKQTATLTKAPVPEEDLNASMFAKLTSPSSHDLSDLAFGKIISLAWTNPSGMTPDHVNMVWWDVNDTLWDVYAEVASGQSSGSLDTIGTKAPGYGAYLFIEELDADGRDFTLMWDFH